MGWQLWVTLVSTFVVSIAMLCCVALCAMRCFYPAGTRYPKVRAFLPWRVADRPAGARGQYIVKNGELAWRDAEAPPPREAYQA